MLKISKSIKLLGKMKSVSFMENSMQTLWPARYFGARTCNRGLGAAFVTWSAPGDLQGLPSSTPVASAGDPWAFSCLGAPGGRGPGSVCSAGFPRPLRALIYPPR